MPQTRWLMRRLRGLIRFRLGTLLLLLTLAAVLLAWRQDHLRLVAEIDRLRNPGPHWGVREATGAPNTSAYGDVPTAWASKAPDSQQEWLLLTFPRPIDARSLHVYETYNPGALVKVTSVNLAGVERTLWQGIDPTPRTASGGVSRIPVPLGTSVKRVKLYFDSVAVKGWNEIDAVGLVDAQGTVTWAQSAIASSAYSGEPGSTYPFVR